jgi:glycosyltransferase involved in cell wall biosynthesis
MRAAGLRPALADIYGLLQRDARQAEEFGPFVRDEFGAINVFHINGDEVAQSLAHTAARQGPGAYNVIYPAWELSRYPREWAEQLERFDEVWAPSRFIRESIAPAVSKPVYHMPLACEVILHSFLGRRYFGIPESAYAFLFFYDLRSYASRKNPGGVIEAFRAFRRERPRADAVLVMKVNGAVENPKAFRELQAHSRELGERIVLLERTMSDNEVKNLVRCCDCFISLHRSEGFGRGMAEAMYLGRPVIATGYSGNMDFCSESVALLVRFSMIAVGEGEYPHAAGQVWAQPDAGHAAEVMVRLSDDPAWGRALGHAASVAIRKGFGLRAAGQRYRARLEAIRAILREREPAIAEGMA